MVTFPGYAPLYVAHEQKLFKGVSVDLLRIESISDLRAAMRAGRIDIYLATYDIFQSSNDQPPGVAFLAIDESHGADGVIVDSTISTVEQLKGRSVAAEPGFPPYFLLQYALHRGGLSLRDVVFKDMTSQDAGTAFAAGHFPAVGTYEPYLSKAAETKVGSRILLSSKETPHLIVDFAFADSAALAMKRDVFVAFAQGWFDALEHIKQYSVQDMAIMARAFNVSEDEMREFSSVVSWLDLTRNKALFDSNASQNAFVMFDSVGAILDGNGARGGKWNSQRHLTGAIINEVRLPYP